jgi:hypothetical protein
MITPPEPAYLLSCIRPGSPPALPPSPDLDWAALLDLASQQGVLPLLYQHLTQNVYYQPPEPVFSRLKSAYQANAYRNLRLGAKLLWLLDLLAGQGIPALAIKGPALAVQAYGDLSLRQFADLDLLVHPGDRSSACALLMQNGFTSAPASLIADPQGSHPGRAERHLVFAHQGDSLELHWKFSHHRLGSPLAEAEFWQSPAEIVLLDRPLLTFSPHVALWAACLHGTIHGWTQLKWIADLAHLCSAPDPLDWDAIFARARRTGYHRLLCTSLLLAQEPGGAGLPQEVVARIHADRHALSLAESIRCGLFDPSSTSNFALAKIHTRSRERLLDRARFWRELLFVPDRMEQQHLPLPAGLSGLHSLTRPFRLLFTYLPRFLKSLSSRPPQA